MEFTKSYHQISRTLRKALFQRARRYRVRCAYSDSQRAPQCHTEVTPRDTARHGVLKASPLTEAGTSMLIPS